MNSSSFRCIFIICYRWVDRKVDRQTERWTVHIALSDEIKSSKMILSKAPFPSGTEQVKLNYEVLQRLC